jgi:hypothetical protein
MWRARDNDADLHNQDAEFSRQQLDVPSHTAHCAALTGIATYFRVVSASIRASSQCTAMNYKEQQTRHSARRVAGHKSYVLHSHTRVGRLNGFRIPRDPRIPGVLTRCGFELPGHIWFK